MEALLELCSALCDLGLSISNCCWGERVCCGDNAEEEEDDSNLSTIAVQPTSESVSKNNAVSEINTNGNGNICTGNETCDAMKTNIISSDNVIADCNENVSMVNTGSNGISTVATDTSKDKVTKGSNSNDIHV